MIIDLSVATTVFLLVSAGSSFALIVSLRHLAARRRTSAGYFIALFWFCFGVWMFATALALGKAQALQALLLWYFIPLAYSVGPALYLFLLTRHRREFRASDLRHFLIPILAFLWLLPYSLEPADYKIKVHAASHAIHIPADLSLLRYWTGMGDESFFEAAARDLLYGVLIGPKISVLCYTLSLVLQRFFAGENAAVSPAKGSRPRLALNLVALFVMIACLFSILGHFAEYRLMLGIASVIIIFIGVSFFVLDDRIGIFAAFTGPHLSAPEKKASFRDREDAELLEKYLDESRIFTREGISITAVAGELDLPPHRLSRAINSATGLNFNQYINLHRIRLAQRLLLEDPERTVYSIALEVGFNAKSAFNRAFLKYSGLTPKEYRLQNS